MATNGEVSPPPVGEPWSSTVKTIVVVPCYNEATRLEGEVFIEFARSNPWLGFLFVDDGSSDDTALVLSGLVEQVPGQLVMTSLAQNSGKAEAVRTGINQALGSNASHIGYWDADLATGLDIIEIFAAELEQNPEKIAVLAARVQLLGRKMDRSPVRHYLGRVFATAASLILSLPVYDTQCGAKLFRVTPEIAAAFDRPFLSRWSFDVEILARLCATMGSAAVEARVMEYPIPLWRDVQGSKLHPLQMIKAFLDLLLIPLRYRRG